MKQFLLTSSLGHWSLAIRDRMELLYTAWVKPEAVGTLANDQLATFLVTRLCQPQMIFVDVGAHIGSIIAEVKRQCRPSKIHAVEAIPNKAQKLQRAFVDAVIHNCAVGDSDGEIAFYENIKLSGYSSLVKPDPSQDGIREIKVPLRKLDDLVPHSGVDVIKIDVEGAELSVLSGAVNLIRESRPIVMFESGPGEEQTKKQIMHFFRERDYAILAPNRLAHNDSGMEEDTFIEGHLYPRRTTNYFAVPCERRLDIRDRARAILNISQVSGVDCNSVALGCQN